MISVQITISESDDTKQTECYRVFEGRGILTGGWSLLGLGQY